MDYDLCPSSCEPVPLGGSVRCLCGQHWTDHDKQGEPRFRVPMHNTKGHPMTPEKVRKALDRAFEAKKRKSRPPSRPRNPHDVFQRGLKWGRQVQYG